MNHEQQLEKFEILIQGFESKAQAESFWHWFVSQGEQQCDQWFEIAGLPTPFSDTKKKTIVKGNRLTFHVESVE